MSVKINYSVCVHGDEGTCHSVQQCGSLMCFYGSEEEEISGCDTHTHLLVDTFTVGLSFSHKKMYHRVKEEALKLST